jgi:hypothetical protein
MARRSAEVKQRARERGVLQEIVVLGLTAKGHLLAPLTADLEVALEALGRG